MRSSDWSSDVCSSDLTTRFAPPPSSRTSRPMTRRIFINRRRSLLARRGPGPTGPRAAGQAPSGGIETRSEERRVGKGCVSTGRSRGCPYHEKKQRNNKTKEKNTNIDTTLSDQK